MWQRAQTLAFNVIGIVRKLPHTWENAVIARQIIASATSVSANIAEGHARFTPGAHINHLSIAKGSAAETDSWLDLLHRLNYISAEEERSYHQECLWIMGALTGKINDLKRLGQSSRNQIEEVTESYISITTIDQNPYWPFVGEDYQPKLTESIEE
jgi:four helix bundle protein